MPKQAAQHCSRCEKSRKRLKVLEKRLTTQMATISQQYVELRGYRINLLQYEAAVKANAEAAISANRGLQGEDSFTKAGHDSALADVEVDVCGGLAGSDGGHSIGEDE